MLISLNRNGDYQGKQGTVIAYAIIKIYLVRIISMSPPAIAEGTVIGQVGS